MPVVKHLLPHCRGVIHGRRCGNGMIGRQTLDTWVPNQEGATSPSARPAGEARSGWKGHQVGQLGNMLQDNPLLGLINEAMLQPTPLSEG